MNDKVKVVAIIALAVVAVVGLYLYYSPYQSCVRATIDAKRTADYAAALCSRGGLGR